jgi:hypothetical protein
VTAYTIYNRVSAACLGTYEADSPEAAIDAMCRDAGYAGHRDAAVALGQMPQAFCADFLVYAAKWDACLPGRVLDIRELELRVKAFERGHY